MGFGPIAPEKDEPVFHKDWERRALGITLCCDMLGAWTIDESRHALEGIPPAAYLAASYYEKWIRGLDILLERHGFATRDELLSGHKQLDDPRSKNILKPGMVAEMLSSGPSQRAVDARPLFSPGQRVRTRNFHSTAHTRLPRYARGKTGVVDAIQGFYVFPDDNAHGKGENPQWVYTVVFDAAELWGSASDPSLTVSIDAWESYLEHF
jgi:nitrile hydratase